MQLSEPQEHETEISMILMNRQSIRTETPSLWGVILAQAAGLWNMPPVSPAMKRGIRWQQVTLDAQEGLSGCLDR
ncbi:hypothetical protein [Bifidobacterium sp. ESL0790]|uniref:hypothetical protein n=1 Tax=Bifidobacterium sp. ESL0790 TaxID=2983233 RepID=UPI0023FA068C|nr:hypothetical protein [Bifidobacterium sp. ESL0790]WEV72912.1 hypothetical protein OZY47_02855 [Bifidobacterium sp. ESL0790]